MNGSERGGAGFNFQAGREVKTIREDCPPGKAFLGAVIYLDPFPDFLCMRTSFPSAHSPFTQFSKQRRKGGQKVPRALCPTHLSRSKCSSPVPPNAPISRQRLCECAVMLRMLRNRSTQFPFFSGALALYLRYTGKDAVGRGSFALASVRPIIPLASCIHASV
nr:hypothetical protein [Raphanus sativus]QGW48554.1 hypothetical protein [Raphanus sativus]